MPLPAFYGPNTGSETTPIRTQDRNPYVALQLQTAQSNATFPLGGIHNGIQERTQHLLNRNEEQRKDSPMTLSSLRETLESLPTKLARELVSTIHPGQMRLFSTVEGSIAAHRPRKICRRAALAEELLCRDVTNCKSMSPESTKCFSAIMHGRILNNRPGDGNEHLSVGSIPGDLVSSNMKNTSGDVSNFFPSQITFYERLFLPAILRASSKYRPLIHISPIMHDHLEGYYKNNQDFIDRNIEKVLNDAIATRKGRLLKSFQKHSTTVMPQERFTNATQIDNGEYRRSPDSPIGGEVFVKAMLRTFNISDQNIVITLPQLAFCCATLIMKYTSAALIPRPALFIKVPKAGKRVGLSYSDKRSIFGCMCAALGNVLDEEAQAVTDGWKAGRVFVHSEDQSRGWLDEFKVLVGSVKL